MLEFDGIATGRLDVLVGRRHIEGGSLTQRVLSLGYVERPTVRRSERTLRHSRHLESDHGTVDGHLRDGQAAQSLEEGVGIARPQPSNEPRPAVHVIRHRRAPSEGTPCAEPRTTHAPGG